MVYLKMAKYLQCAPCALGGRSRVVVETVETLNQEPGTKGKSKPTAKCSKQTNNKDVVETPCMLVFSMVVRSAF